MSDLKTLVEMLLNDLSTIADDTGWCPICGQEEGHGYDCSLDALERALEGEG
jgi:hypothetical protein